MSKKRIPKINPRILQASEEYLKNLSSEKQVRLKLLKQQLIQGTYHPSSTVLARSIVPSR